MGHLDRDVQEAAESDKAEPWGTGGSISASKHLLSGSAYRPLASPLGATRSGAKAVGRGRLSVSLQPARPLQPHFSAIARDVVCWLPRGSQGHLPGKGRPLLLTDRARQSTNQ